MKSRFYAILTLLVLFLSVSCGNKDKFILQGTVTDATDTILVAGFDSRFERVDTIVCSEGRFKWTFSPDTVTTLILILPDGRRFPVFADKNVESTIVIPSDTGRFSISGGYCNDSYHSFYLSALNDTAPEQTYARIDSFITRDPFSEVTPYLIYSEMLQRYHADESTVMKMIERMSGNMQDAPYLTTLKTEFKGKPSANVYLSSWAIRDSAGVTTQFTGIGGNNDFVLICVWASWAGDEAFKARRDMDSLRTKYAGRHLIVADVSIDVNTGKWLESIRKDTLEWTSYIDNKGWESRVVRSCNINRMPVYVLSSGTKRVVLATSSFSEMDRRLERELPQAVKPESKTNKNRK